MELWTGHYPQLIRLVGIGFVAGFYQPQVDRESFPLSFCDTVGRERGDDNGSSSGGRDDVPADCAVVLTLSGAAEDGLFPALNCHCLWNLQNLTGSRCGFLQQHQSYQRCR